MRSQFVRMSHTIPSNAHALSCDSLTPISFSAGVFVFGMTFVIWLQNAKTLMHLYLGLRQRLDSLRHELVSFGHVFGHPIQVRKAEI